MQKVQGSLPQRGRRANLLALLEVRGMTRPVVVVDLFCGMGGFSYGAMQAGGTVILAVDNWGEACAVHHANQPNVRVDCMDLGGEGWDLFLEAFLKPYRGKFHIHIHGSPPCQALSVASTHNEEDGMRLVNWYLDLVERVSPNSWSMENVLPVRRFLPENLRHDVINAADFGVPQRRRRVFAGEGWEVERTHEGEWVSVAQALPHIEKLVPIESMKRHYQHARVEDPYQTVTSNSPKQLKVMVNTAGSGESTNKAAVTRDSPISKTSLTIYGRQPSLRTDEPRRIRALTVEETLVLQGFPSDYDMDKAGKTINKWTMLGNAVPPPVARAIITGIRSD